MTADALIRVTGDGRVEAPPDRCILQVVLRATAETTDAALTAVSRCAEQALGTLRQAGVGSGDVKTLTVTLEDRYEPRGDRVVGRIAGYHLRVTVAELARAGDVLSALASAVGDALDVRGVELSVGDPEPLAREARHLAVLDARAKAEQLAAAAGVPLGALVSLEEVPRWGGGRPGPPGVLRAAAASAAPIPPLPIGAGSLEVAVSVVAAYAGPPTP